MLVKTQLLPWKPPFPSLTSRFALRAQRAKDWDHWARERSTNEAGKLDIRQCGGCHGSVGDFLAGGFLTPKIRFTARDKRPYKQSLINPPFFETENHE